MENTKNKKFSPSRYVGIGIVVVVIIIAMYVLLSGRNLDATRRIPNQGSIENTGSQSLKFADSPIAEYAYLISTSTYDASTTLALTGFAVTKKALPDGSQQITLTAQKTEYQNQTYIVKPGQKLYFIEMFLQDDKNEQEKNLKDDKAILVDVDGTIIQQ